LAQYKTNSQKPFNMKQFCISLIFLFSFWALHAQEDFRVPDYEQIAQLIDDPQSDYFYPKLLAAFQNRDTSLTDLDYYYLYYGRTLQDDWISMTRFDDEETRAILNKEAPTKEELLTAKKMLLSYLNENPVDLKRLYDLMVVTKMLEDPDYEKLRIQLQGLIVAILQTGDGLSLETAFHVNKISDEYFLLAILGFNIDGSQSLFYPCDYLEVAENEEGIEGLYFNVQQHFNSLSKALGGVLPSSAHKKKKDKKRKKKEKKRKKKKE